ncbi:MAG TPA: T9SS type A sorting domain-containing protein, partial [bacterium (Candidatus Stahlbacteria)]|nr:T9SS type A sorting domain-containing protein [Candidatus Stahlbacteria bacterium]
GVLLRWDFYIWEDLYIELTRAIVECGKAYIVVLTQSQANQVRSTLQNNGVPTDSVEFFYTPTNSVWIRDYGPWWIYHLSDSTWGIVDFEYNRPRPDDDTMPWHLAHVWNVPLYISDLVHTGGNFMVDGLGCGFASNLIYQENSYTPQEIESILGAYMGLDTLYVFQRINGEYTGHIDMWAKLLDDHTALIAYYPPGDPNHNLLNQHAERFAQIKNGNGIYFDTVRIPSPPVYSGVYRSYTNSLIFNERVLLPIYNHPYDTVAIRIYQQVMPGYEIKTFDCSEIIEWGGAVHCITKLVALPKQPGPGISLYRFYEPISYKLVGSNPGQRFKLRFILDKLTPVQIYLIDQVGRTVRRIVSRVLDAGDYLIPIDGSGLASGVYLLRIVIGNDRATEKIVVVD